MLHMSMPKTRAGRDKTYGRYGQMKTEAEKRAAAYQKARDVWVGLGQLRRAIDEGADLASIRQRANELVGQAGDLVGKLAHQN